MFDAGKIMPCAREGLQCCSPPLFAGKPFVEQVEHFGNVELDVFEVKVLLVVLLHLEKIVEFQVKLEESAIAS